MHPFFFDVDFFLFKIVLNRNYLISTLPLRPPLVKRIFVVWKRILMGPLGKGPRAAETDRGRWDQSPIEARAMKMKQVMKGTAIWVMAMSK